MSSVVYDERFFTALRETTLYSSRLVVPMIIDMIRPTSVIDIGCGEGAWLLGFKECGISKLCGIDGEYVERSRLLIDRSCFEPADLSGAFLNITGNYDLAVCLEVAEHLSPKNGDRASKGANRCSSRCTLFRGSPGSRRNQSC
jgi:2-polyprenyl-3-methyl-5-hydroxy-6-metoxy-1,4-benzoquinol methylase